MKRRDVIKGSLAVGAATLIQSRPSHAQQVDAAKKWVDSEFQPSTRKWSGSSMPPSPSPA